jgi:hypothetical protein
MPNLEIVVSDLDLKSMDASWTGGSNIFLTQVDVDEKKSLIMLNASEALQTIAALKAFLAGASEHASSCALHRSPAYPIGECDCGTHTAAL